MYHFRNNTADKRIYDRLNKDLHAIPNENYNLLEAEILDSMITHMETKLVKFNRKKHKRDSWITYGILKSVNRKKYLIQKKENWK